MCVCVCVDLSDHLLFISNLIPEAQPWLLLSFFLSPPPSFVHFWWNPFLRVCFPEIVLTYLFVCHSPELLSKARGPLVQWLRTWCNSRESSFSRGLWVVVVVVVLFAVCSWFPLKREREQEKKEEGEKRGQKSWDVKILSGHESLSSHFVSLELSSVSRG